MLLNLRNKDKLQSELQNVQLQVTFLERELNKARDANKRAPPEAVNQFGPDERKALEDGFDQELVEIGEKLLHLLQTQGQDRQAARFQHYQKYSVNSILEIIDLAEQAIKMERQQRDSSQGSSDIVIGAATSTRRAPQERSPDFQARGRVRMKGSTSHENIGTVSNLHQRQTSPYASTADASLLLDEKEKRLALKEELVSCKEKMLSMQY